MARQMTEQTQEVHTHYWKSSYRPEEQYCQCGCIKLSEAEYQRRTKEWESYFELVKTTPAYRDFMEMKTASPQKKRAILERVKARETEDSYLSKPSFPDPATWSKYIYD